MQKVFVLKKKPKIKLKNKVKSDINIDILSIKEAMETLGIKYKRVDEIDIYNIYQFILNSNKELD